MSDSGGVVRDISWRDLCPWLMLTRTFSLAITMQVMLAALLAVTLAPIGWQIADRVLFGGNKSPEVLRSLSKEEQEIEDQRTAMLPLLYRVGNWPGVRVYAEDAARRPAGPSFLPAGATGLRPAPIETAPVDPILGVFDHLAAPFQQLFSPNLTWRMGLMIFGGALWTLLVWCVPGAIITRAAALQFGREEPLDWDQAFAFAGKKWTSYLIGPLVPLAGVFALAMLLAIGGLIMRIPLVGPIAVGVMWFLSLLTGFTMAMILLGLLFGWPLMWATIGAEASDAFDSLSRSYSYTFQRPFQYLFYVLVSFVLGILGWLLVWQFSEAIIALTHWGLAFGLSEEYLAVALMENTAADAPIYANWALYLIQFWEGVVRALATSFSFGYFWCAAVGYYLLLRRDVDQMEIDEIAVEEPEEKFTLPKLKPHVSGVPSVEPTSSSPAPIKEAPVAHTPPPIPPVPPLPPANDVPPPAGP